ncbi:MAG TPA: hypothetical protein VMK13_03100 [Streptosporangiaceae bacterium]|nr:hypothetical protein [Streptosporangiaceae bacterium]
MGAILGRRRWRYLSMGGVAALVVLAAACSASSAPGSAASRPAAHARPPFLTRFHSVRQIASTVPSNGDVNPYGVAVVPHTAGRLVGGDTLVSNFNNTANVQGTGTTIAEISPGGARRTFARIRSLPASHPCPGGVGLTTALDVLPGGWVVVGSLPTSKDGTLPAVNPTGCLIVLNSAGNVVTTWSNPDINGPWDMTMQATASGADLFLANVLSRPAGASSAPPPAGLCTVVRIDVALHDGQQPAVTSTTVIGSGFPWQQNKAALIQGPTGLALGRNGTLYVAETVTSSIGRIPGAGTRATAVTAGTDTLTKGGSLNGPLGLTSVPGGDLVAVNGNDGNAVEVSPQGKQVATVTLVRNGAGDLFGIAPVADGHGLLFVNDGTNALEISAA